MKKHTRASFNGQGVSFLTREQMELIHSATLQLLQEMEQVRVENIL